MSLIGVIVEVAAIDAVMKTAKKLKKSDKGVLG